MVKSDDRFDTTLQTVETTFEIIDFIQEHDGARVTEIAEGTGFSKSTVHRHLSTLKEMGHVVTDDDLNEIGLTFLSLGMYAKRKKKSYVMAAEKVEELAEDTNERVYFMVEENGQAIIVHYEVGKQGVQTDPEIGDRIPLHSTAAGKAILANLPAEKRDRIIETSGLPAQTEQTITEEGTLREELESIRRREYSYNREENTAGLYAVGVPINDIDGRVIGALSISGPRKRMQKKGFTEDLPMLLLGTANEIEINIT